jgi:predicted site-specific integrase-resolvase
MIEISKKELAEKYRTMTSANICKELGISLPTLRSYLKKAGIPLKKAGGKSKIKLID